MLIYWVAIFAVQAILCAASPAVGSEVYGPSKPQQGVPPVQEKEEKEKVSPKEFVDDDGHPAEHAFKSLPTTSDYTVIPLPSFSYNRNERYWAGALAPILKANSKGEIEDILAPQYLYNPLVGHGGSVSYYGYPSDTEQYHALAWYSQKIDRGVDLGYKNLSAGGGRYILAADFAAFKNPFARFFGFGSRTTEAQETNYTSRELLLKLTAGINLTPDLSLMLTERLRIVRVDDGVVGSLPRTKQLFPAIPGIAGAQVLGHGLVLRYDTRDNQLIPTKGTYVNLLAEFNQNLQPNEENQWGHATFDARHLIPHASDRMVFVSRVFFNGVFGQIERRGTTLGVPFYEQPTLGGEDTLRAFGRGRYIGSWAVLANLEERVNLLNRKMFDHEIRLEIAPFLDMGRVGRTGVEAERLLYRNIQFNPGAGIRLLAKPNIVGRLDVAYGKDGANVFVGLDYPF
ncbi:MAG: BamA/TamA family outer membrane protein [Nitrospirae bacterium]|nr:BamA/TamA family outer membrane protein [Nitrospirota bacterium]